MNIEKLKIKRIHDEIYLKGKPVIKESFKFLLKQIIINQKKFESLIDIGCSNGAFLKYASTILKNKNLNGADIRKDLILSAKKNCPNANFYQMDISKKTKVHNKKFDVCVLDGVHSIFDNHEDWLKNLLNLCNKNGSIYIFGSFNPEPYDIFVKVKHFKSKILESGFNRLSLASLKESLTKKKFSFSVKRFDISIDLKKDKNDPRRTYTVRLKDNKKLTINGLEQVSTKFLVIAKRK
jgi:trans-aconitate methyltransferase